MTERLVHVHYPLPSGRLVLHTDRDWAVPVLPVEQTATRSTFRLPGEGPAPYFKPVWEAPDAARRWSAGENWHYPPGAAAFDAYPHFQEGACCSAGDLQTLTSPDGTWRYRVFLPPGYDENPLRRYRLLVMQDGQNLFFPGEAFGGNHWKIDETLEILRSMSLVDPLIVVGVWPNDRTAEYTKPGWDAYTRFVADHLVPAIDAEHRTRPGPEHRAVMGSSLGGVISLHLAWSRPDVFGMAACLSSTFGWRDDLAERIAAGPKRPLRLWLDSGWPRDNYEATLGLVDRLRGAGYEEGRDLMYFAFPDGRHNEVSWAMRAHLPLQYFFRGGAAVGGSAPGDPRRGSTPDLVQIPFGASAAQELLRGR